MGDLYKYRTDLQRLQDSLCYGTVFAQMLAKKWISVNLQMHMSIARLSLDQNLGGVPWQKIYTLDSLLRRIWYRKV